jgi:hypothetical protein
MSDIHKQCASGDQIYFTNTLYLEEFQDNSIKKITGIPFQVGGEIEEDVIALAEDMKDLIGGTYINDIFIV